MEQPIQNYEQLKTKTKTKTKPKITKKVRRESVTIQNYQRPNTKRRDTL